jgi:hypothetical protein
MTKAEFKEQFKRLRIAGYRLPLMDGVTVDDVLAEWYGTFGECSREEFSEAIDRLKREKTDTFWPAAGELWAHVYEVRKARRIRMQSRRDETGVWAMSDADTQEFLSLLREARDKILRKMPHAEPQTAPQHVQDEMDRAEEA